MTFTYASSTKRLFMQHDGIEKLVHLLDESIDMILTVTEITTLNEMSELACSEPTSWVGKLEWPEEVVDLLEVWSDGDDLVNDIFDADNAILSERFLDDGIIGQWNALFVDFAITALVDELSDGLEIWITISNIWFDNTEHFDSSLGETNKYTIVDLKETKKLKSLALLWVNFVDTFDSDYESKFWFSGNIEGAIGFGNTSETDLLPLCLTIFLNVLLGALEDGRSLFLVGVLLLLGFSGTKLACLFLGLSLLENSLWCQDVVVSGNGRSRLFLSGHCDDVLLT